MEALCDEDREEPEHDSGRIEARIGEAERDQVRGGEPQQRTRHVSAQNSGCVRDDRAQKEARDKPESDLDNLQPDEAWPDEPEQHPGRQLQDRAPVLLTPEKDAEVTMLHVTRHEVDDRRVGVLEPKVGP